PTIAPKIVPAGLQNQRGTAPRGRPTRCPERSGSFLRQPCRQLIGARRFTGMSRRLHIWSVVHRGCEARADLTLERAADRRRSLKPKWSPEPRCIVAYAPAEATPRTSLAKRL